MKTKMIKYLIKILTLFAFLQIFIVASANAENIEIIYENSKKMYNQGKYNDALNFAKKCLEISESEYGNRHINTALSLSILGMIYSELGSYSQAVAAHERCLGIYKANFSKSFRDISLILSNLANAYSKMNEYQKAKVLYTESIDILNKNFGDNNIDVAIVMSNLCDLNIMTNNYDEAIKLCNRSLEIKEKKLGKNDACLTYTLDSLAAVYTSIQDFGKAESLLKRSIDISTQTNGVKHPRTVFTKQRLADLLLESGNLSEAEKLYKNILSTKEEILGKDHPEISSCLNNLACIYIALNDKENAKILLERSIALDDNKFGKESDKKNSALSNLALLYIANKEFSKAENTIQKLLSTIKFNCEGSKASLKNDLRIYALFLLNQEKYDEAWNIMLQVDKLNEELLEKVMSFASESQQLAFVDTFRMDHACIFNLANQYLSKNQNIINQSFNIWLKNKGKIFESQKEYYESIFKGNDQSSKKLINELSVIRKELAKQMLVVPEENSKNINNKIIDELILKKEKIEHKLAETNKKIAMVKIKNKVDYTQLRKALPKGGVLLDFIRTEGNEGYGSLAKQLKTSHYAVYILTANSIDPVKIIDLGESSIIDHEIMNLQRALNGGNEDQSSVQAAEVVKKSCLKLYQMLFSPIKNAIFDNKNVYLSPDGLLNMLPFEILCDNSGKFLILDYTFTYLAAGRDILGFGLFPEASGTNILIGNPDYNLDEKSQEKEAKRLQVRSSRNFNISTPQNDMKNLHFSPLPGTEKEVLAISSILGKTNTEIFLRKQALEEVIFSKQSPGILHLATHGFFINKGESLESGKSNNNLFYMLSSDAMYAKQTHDEVNYISPLLRSGIALAGANISYSDSSIMKGSGILTAYKILNLNLIGANLVVLSACESGLGEVKSGEGIFGMRRAFSQAGAKSMVTSMWAVPDAETKDLMVSFYKNIQEKKMNRAQALRSAAIDVLTSVSIKYGHSNPYFWGAFTFTGEP